MHVLENTFFNDIMSLGSSFANALCYRLPCARRVKTLEWNNRVAHYIKSSGLRLLETSAVLVFRDLGLQAYPLVDTGFRKHVQANESLLHPHRE